jgi:hypothetical protein
MVRQAPGPIDMAILTKIFLERHEIAYGIAWRISNRAANLNRPQWTQWMHAAQEFDTIIYACGAEFQGVASRGHAC